MALSRKNKVRMSRKLNRRGQFSKKIRKYTRNTVSVKGRGRHKGRHQYIDLHKYIPIPPPRPPSLPIPPPPDPLFRSPPSLPIPPPPDPVLSRPSRQKRWRKRVSFVNL